MSIIQNNEKFVLGSVTDIHTKLPVGNYSLKYSQNEGYYLQKQADFKHPEKLYGDFSFIDRWLKAKENTNKNLGILLSGIKGTGKTISAQLFAQRANCPVIFITFPASGSEFENFISHPVFKGSIIFIDEFEKVYNNHDDEYGTPDTLLTLMDGIYHTNLTFLLTVNDSNKINDRMQNRLNRIRYHRIFTELPIETCFEIIDDKLIYPEHKESFKKFLDKAPLLSMDIITAVISEVNLFNESANNCAKHLNLIEEYIKYDVKVILENPKESIDSSSIWQTRSLRNFTLNFYYTPDARKGERFKKLDDSVVIIEEWEQFRTGQDIILKKDGVTIKLSRFRDKLLY